MKKVILLPILFMLLIATDSFAAKRYWIASASAYWNNTANWSATSGGAGGSSVPGINDTAYFDGNGLGNDTLNANVDIKSWRIAAGYSGKIVQGSYTIKVGTGLAVLSGGTFEGGSGSITSGGLTISGCTYTSTSGTHTGSSFSLTSGSFAHNNGKVKLNNTGTVTGSVTMYDLEFAPVSSSTYTISSGTIITVDNDLTYSGTASMAVNTGTIDVKKDLHQTNTGGHSTGGTATIRMIGTTKQTIYGHASINGPIPNLVINKSDTLALTSSVIVGGDFTHTAGHINAGTSTLVFKDGVSKTISASVELYNVTFYYWVNNSTYTIASGKTLTVKGTLTYTGDNGLSLNTGTLHAKGNFTIGNTSSGVGGGTATIVLNGSGTQTITAPTTFGIGRLCNIQINKPYTDTLRLLNVLSVAGDWTYSSGIVDAGTSVTYFQNTKTISGTHALYHVYFGASATATFTIASGDTLTAKGPMTVAGNSSTISINTGTLHVEGDISTTNTSTSTGGTATITINGSGNQTITGSGTAGAGKLPNIIIDKPGGILTLVSVISVTGSWIYSRGDVDPTTSTVVLYGTSNLDGQAAGTSTCMRFYNLTVGGNTRTLTGNLDVNSNLTISSGTTLSAAAYTINVGGNWNSQGTWTYSTSTVVFDGSSYNTIKGASGTTVNFANVTLNRGAGSVTLQNPMKVNTAMTFAKGRMIAATSFYLEFPDNATCTVTNDDSAYVHGPVRKTGNDAFTFPLGDTTLHDSIAYHPLAITAPGSAADRYEAVYRATAQTQGATLVDSLFELSTVENWSLERQVGTSVVGVTISWNRNSSNANVFGDLRVANWNGTMWSDLGASSITINGGQGLITATSNPTYVSNYAYLTLAKGKNNFPFAVLKKKLDGGYYKAINGRLFFKFDEEYNETGDLTFNIYNDEHVLVSTTLWMPTTVRPQVVYGDNRYHLNTVGCDITPSGALGNGFYILEVINDKNEVWYLRFQQDSNIILSNCPPSSETE